MSLLYWTLNERISSELSSSTPSESYYPVPSSQNLGLCDNTLGGIFRGLNWRGFAYNVKGRFVMKDPQDGLYNKDKLSVSFWIKSFYTDAESDPTEWNTLIFCVGKADRSSDTFPDYSIAAGFYGWKAYCLEASYLSAYLKNKSTLVLHTPGGTKQEVSLGTYPNSGWHHVVMTLCVGGKDEIIVDGETIYSGDNIVSSYMTVVRGTGDYFWIQSTERVFLRDLKIYDHILSKSEIYDLGKFMLRHYKFDRIGSSQINENLLKNSEALATSSWTALSGTTLHTGTVGNAGVVNKGFNLVKDNTVTIGGMKQSLSSTLGNVSGTANKIPLRLSFKCNSSTGCTLHVKLLNGSAEIASFTDSGGLTISQRTNSNSWVVMEKSIVYTPPTTSSTLYIQFGFSGSESSTDLWICAPKLEISDITTSFNANSTDAENYGSTKSYPSNDLLIEDTSGNQSDGVLESIVSPKRFGLTKGSPRSYSKSTYLDSTYIQVSDPFDPYTSTEATFSFWAKLYNQSTSAIWNGRNSMGTDFSIFFIKPSGGKYGLRVDTRTSSGENDHTNYTPSITFGNWNHYAVTIKNGGKKIVYVNGIEIGRADTNWFTYTDKTNLKATIGISSEGNVVTTSSSNNSFIGSLSDFRIYNREFSADEVEKLYSMSALLGNTGVLFEKELGSPEGTGKPTILKSGRVTGSLLSEIGMRFDSNIYTEPDGSKWIRIYHYNNPSSSSNLFSAADKSYFENSGFKKNDNHWINVTACNFLKGSWEFMIKQKKLSTTTTESKYRWVQFANPLTATWDDVSSSNVVKNKSEGYTVSTFGGIWKYDSDSKTFMAANNGISGNYYGAIGSYAVYNGGVPAYNAVIVTTGYTDLYLRIDEVPEVSYEDVTSYIGNGNIFDVDNFIEN